MNLLKADKRWITFNVREEMLNDLRMGDKIKVMVPALGKKEIETEIYYIRDMDRMPHGGPPRPPGAGTAARSR